MPEQSEPVNEQVSQSEDFESVYANNVLFESSIWDLKMLFGQLSLSNGRQRIELHTAVTIPWLQAKLMAYYLQSNLTFYEGEHGPIKIPQGMTPPPLPAPADSRFMAAREAVDKIRQQLLADIEL
jgi:hypothetical protein